MSLPVMVPIDGEREKRVRDLRNGRQVYVEYMRLKIDEEDWHGVSDVANDLREVDAELRGLCSR